MKYKDKLYFVDKVSYSVFQCISFQNHNNLDTGISGDSFNEVIDSYKQSSYFKNPCKAIMIYISNPNGIGSDTKWSIIKEFSINERTYFNMRELSMYAATRFIYLSPDCSEIYGECFEFGKRDCVYDYSLLFDGIRLDTNKKYISEAYDNFDSDIAYENDKLCTCHIYYYPGGGYGFSGDDVKIGNYNGDQIYVAYGFEFLREKYSKDAIGYCSEDLVLPYSFIPAKLFKEYNP